MKKEIHKGILIFGLVILNIVLIMSCALPKQKEGEKTVEGKKEQVVLAKSEDTKQNKISIKKYVFAGKILDKITEEPITNAEIKLFIDGDNYVKTYSTKDGSFSFTDINIDIYKVEIFHKNYETAYRENVIFSDGSKIDFKLQIKEQMYYSGIVPKIKGYKVNRKKVHEVKTNYKDPYQILRYYGRSSLCINSDDNGNIYYLNSLSGNIIKINGFSNKVEKIKLYDVDKNILGKIFSINIIDDLIVLGSVSRYDGTYIFNLKGKLLNHINNMRIYSLKKYGLDKIVAVIYNDEKSNTQIFEAKIINREVTILKPDEITENKVISDSYIYSIKEEAGIYFMEQKLIENEKKYNLIPINSADKIINLGYDIFNVFLKRIDDYGNIYVGLKYNLGEKEKFTKAKEYYPGFVEIRKYKNDGKYTVLIRTKSHYFISSLGKIYTFDYEKRNTGKYNISLCEIKGE